MGKRRSSVSVKDRSISPTDGWIWKNQVALESQDSGKCTDTSVMEKLTKESVLPAPVWPPVNHDALGDLVVYEKANIFPTAQPS